MAFNNGLFAELRIAPGTKFATNGLFATLCLRWLCALRFHGNVLYRTPKHKNSPASDIKCLNLGAFFKTPRRNKLW